MSSAASPAIGGSKLLKRLFSLDAVGWRSGAGADVLTLDAATRFLSVRALPTSGVDFGGIPVPARAGLSREKKSTQPVGDFMELG